MSQFLDILQQLKNDMESSFEYQQQRKFNPPPKKITRYYLKDDLSSYLTEREYQCVDLTRKNKTNEEISEQLRLALRTIEFYFRNIRQKMKAKNKTELKSMFKDFDCMFYKVEA